MTGVSQPKEAIIQRMHRSVEEYHFVIHPECQQSQPKHGGNRKITIISIGHNALTPVIK